MPSIEQIKQDLDMLKTAKALTETFRENTGTHFLDSGGAYGRSWERNQALEGWEAFAARPEAFVDRYTDGDIGGFTLDGWHYIVERFEYSRKWQKRYQKFVDERDNPYHLTDMEDFAAHLTGIEDERDARQKDAWRVWNTYNDETLLNEVFQMVCINLDWAEKGEDWLYLMQYHGGCDVRGGYTAPIALTGKENAWWQVQEVEVTCSCSDDFTINYTIGGDIYFYNHETQEDEYLENLDTCPKCGKTDGLEAHAPHYDGGW